MILFFLPFTVIGATSFGAGKIVTEPISVQVGGLFTTNGISVVLRAAMVPDLEAAVTKACGSNEDQSNFRILNLDTHLTLQQPARRTATYAIEGNVTCEVFE